MSAKHLSSVFLEGNLVPTEAVGVECKRENSTGLHPPLNRIHVWWARRPLTASRFAITGSLVGDDWTAQNLLELLGIPKGKDPVKIRALIDEMNRTNGQVSGGFGYLRAFTNVIPERLLAKFHSEINRSSGANNISVLDMFSGGGSIPFEAVRLGLSVLSSELNPVASLLQISSIDFPRRFGSDFTNSIKQAGDDICSFLETKLGKFFPKNKTGQIFAYVWVRTVNCSSCGLEAPLTPNWWLDRDGKIGFRAHIVEGQNAPEYAIEKAGSNGFDPDEGSVARGVGTCIRCQHIIPEDYIKSEAQAGRMGQQMAAVGYKLVGRGGRNFRPPTKEDLQGYKAAEAELARKWPEWEAKGLIPMEDIPGGLKTAEPIRYGLNHWSDLFNPRQLLVHLTTLEAIRDFDYSKIPEDKRIAVRVYLALALDKTLDYNSLLNIYHPSRVVIAHVFARHDFAFSWNYGEFDGAGQLFRWGVDQIVDAYRDIVKLLQGATGTFELHKGDARNLSWIPSESVDAVVTDPPYYGNVMYAELSDFFYVWLKRSVGDLFPEWFAAPLTDKDSEAVANPARFRDASDKRGAVKELASKDYEFKMTQAWEEARRVLKPGGVLTIMFNHKELEAWDALAQSIVQTGFTITASCAISTESEHSLHIREKQAVQKTIFLTARKVPRTSGTWWEDIRRDLRKEVRLKLQNVRKMSPNVSRIDLLMSAYGEGLRVVSSRWPVKDAKGDEIPLRIALEEARVSLQEWYFEDRIGRTPAFDPITKVVLYALEGYGTREAKFDDLQKYGMVLGVGVPELYQGHIAERKGSNVVFLTPEERIRRTNRMDPEREEYVTVWDKVQAAALQFGKLDASAFRRWVRNKGFHADDAFLDACSFLSKEGPDEFIETKMSRNVVGSSSDFRPPSGQTHIEDHAVR